MTLPSYSSQRGSSLFIVLVAIMLFATLTYVVSQQRDSGAMVASERLRLNASDVIDMGIKIADSTARLRLRNVDVTKISFENSVVAGYTNADCSSDSCKIFSYAGGGMDWETPASDISDSYDWVFSGSVGVGNIATTDADLVAFLPNLSLELCNKINVMLGVYDTSGSPPLFNGLTINKYIGTFPGVATSLSHALIDGKKSACVTLRAPAGTAFPPALPNTFYTYYQVLESR